MMMLVVLKKTDCSSDRTEIQNCLLGAGVLGDGLGALRHSMLGKLSWQKEANSSLDLTRGDGGPENNSTKSRHMRATA